MKRHLHVMGNLKMASFFSTACDKNAQDFIDLQIYFTMHFFAALAPQLLLYTNGELYAAEWKIFGLVKIEELRGAARRAPNRKQENRAAGKKRDQENAIQSDGMQSLFVCFKKRKICLNVGRAASSRFQHWHNKS